MYVFIQSLYYRQNVIQGLFRWNIAGFRVFLLLDWLPNKTLSTQSALLFRRRTDGFMSFPKALALCEI